MDIDIRENWIGKLSCETIHPQFCNSVPGCNAKKDAGCTKNGATCYICTGSPELGGKRRRMDVGDMLMDWLANRNSARLSSAEADSPAGELLEEDLLSDG